MGASYIKSTTPYQTFTNDPHKNEIGHEQIALDLYRFIIQETNLKLKDPKLKVKTATLGHFFPSQIFFKKMFIQLC